MTALPKKSSVFVPFAIISVLCIANRSPVLAQQASAPDPSQPVAAQTDSSDAASATDATVSFRSQIAPLLVDHCLACHSTKKAEGGYRVDTFEQLGRPGDSGSAPLIDSESAGATWEDSELLRRITSDDEFERMPAESEPLPAELVEQVRAWLASGASFDGVDARQPLHLVIPPPSHPSAPEHYSHPLPISALAFSHDGKQLITSGYHELLVWDRDDGHLIRRLGNVDQRTHAIEFAPDGQLLVVGGGTPGRSGEARLIDFASGTVLAVFSRTTDVVLDVAFDPTGQRLATASADGLIRVYSCNLSHAPSPPTNSTPTAELALIAELAGHADWVYAIDWSEDGQRLVSASRDNSAKLFDVATGKVLANYQGHGSPVRSAVLVNGDQDVISVGDDHRAHRWKSADGSRVAEMSIDAEPLGLELRESSVWASLSNHQVVQLDLSNNSVARRFEGAQDWLLSVAISPDGATLAAGTHGGRLYLWNANDATPASDWVAAP